MAKKKSKAKKATPIEQDTCFTIMPFGQWFDDYYENIYSPAITSAGLIPRRADDLYRPSAIVSDIWALTKSSKVLLADLTGKNPNVFYELGLAHAIARPAILVAESIEDVPFDLRALRVLIYDKNDFNWGSALREDIKKSIKEVLQSPLEAVLPTFLEVKGTSKQPVTSTEKELIALRQDMDLLKRQIATDKEPIYNRVNIQPGEARRLVSSLLTSGRTDDHIYRILRQRGAPGNWIRETISEGRKILGPLQGPSDESVSELKEKDQPEPPPVGL